MKTLESWTLAYLLNSMWQVPLLFAAGWVAARALRRTGAAIEHRVWVTTLLLESLLPACSVQNVDGLRRLYSWGGQSGVRGDEHVTVAMGAGVTPGALHLPAEVLAAIAITYSAVLAYFVGRFVWRSIALASMSREAIEVPLSQSAALTWAQCASRFGIYDATLASSQKVFGPVTLGLRRKLVLLPAGMLDGLPEEDMQTIIAHEFAHLHRRDFLKNLAYELLSLAISYHPLRWLTRERVIESREIVCDQMAAEFAGRTEYARSLLRLASRLLNGMSARAPHAIGIFDANGFEKRLMKLMEKQKEVGSGKRIAIMAACLAFGVGTCGSLLALRIHVDAASAPNDTRKASAAPLTVPASVMAGNALNKVVPVYPPAAKKAKIQGAVLLHALIGKTGSIEELQAVSGPDDLKQSALDAVRQWTYKPYLLNGEPVDVETTVTVTYSLAP